MNTPKSSYLFRVGNQRFKVSFSHKESDPAKKPSRPMVIGLPKSVGLKVQMGLKRARAFAGNPRGWVESLVKEAASARNAHLSIEPYEPTIGKWDFETVK